MPTIVGSKDNVAAPGKSVDIGKLDLDAAVKKLKKRGARRVEVNRRRLIESKTRKSIDIGAPTSQIIQNYVDRLEQLPADRDKIIRSGEIYVG